MIATATELFEGRHFPGVVALCSDALDSEPECVPLLLLRARARVALRRDLDAQADLRDIIRLDPGCGVAYRLLGELAARQDEYASAAVFFREALRLEPGDREAHDWLMIVSAPSRPAAVAEQLPATAAAAGPLSTPPRGQPRMARGTQAPSLGKAAEPVEPSPGVVDPYDPYDERPTQPFPRPPGLPGGPPGRARIPTAAPTIERPVPVVRSEAERPPVRAESQLPVVRLDSQLSIVRTESQVSARRTESQVSARRTESQVSARRTDSQVSARRTDSQVLARRTDSQVSARRAESQVSARRAESQVLARRTDSQVLARRTDSQVLARRTDSQLSASHAEPATVVRAVPEQPTVRAEARSSTGPVPRAASPAPGGDLPGFGEYLVAVGILTQERLRAAQAYQRSMRVQLSTAVVTLGLASAERVAWAAVAHQSRLARDRGP